jgi:predicted metal-dependent peptidase
MAQHVQTQAEWELEISGRILGQVRSTLYLSLRYLNPALCALRPTAQTTFSTCATDGTLLYYPPAWAIHLYRTNRTYLCRAFLHTVLHCLFRHLWLRQERDPALWNLACDIAVEHQIDVMALPALARPVGWVRQQLYADLQKCCAVLSAGPIYRALCERCNQRPDASEAITKLQREFFCDSHALWPKDAASPAAQLTARQWEHIGRETQLDQQQSGRQSGQDLGTEALELQIQAGRSRRLYRDFLRKFAVLQEEPHLSTEEFDLGYYTYGLSVYGNLPLIEPLETREIQKIRDFVIVLDTSDSTSGELVRAFLKETFTLLKVSERFFSRCNILVMQCDDHVQSETFLTDLSGIDAYMQHFVLHGGGGTDFRPAFRRIRELQQQGTFHRLKGVLYFTDGKGIYPSSKPPFETAFLFLDSGGTPPEVPPWAMKLLLEPEELLPSAPPVIPSLAGDAL